MAEVKLREIGKVFAPGINALRDVSLTVADGELLTLVGPSGAGKTTLLRIIAGLEVPTTGTVSIGGLNLEGAPPSVRGAAMVFQRYSLYPHLTVEENLAFGSHRRRDVAATRRLKEDIVEWLDLSDCLKRLPRELSGGQQQRAALGKALLQGESIVLLDEPLSNIDLPLRTELRRQLRLLQAKLRRTMIYVTHDQLDALSLGDRVAVMRHGRMEQTGRPHDLYKRPANRFVAGFIGWPPMNFLDGRVATENGLTFVDLGGWKVPVDWSKIKQALPSRVTLGVRAEDVVLGRSDPGGASTRMCAELIESIGSELLITVCQAGIRLIAKTAPDQKLEVGQSVTVVMNMQRALWFDSSSGLAMQHSGSG
jgi:multiple sugar transport system ATP-binding protein